MPRFWRRCRFGRLFRSRCGLRRGFGRMIRAAFFRFCDKHGKPTRVTHESNSVAETEAIAGELARTLGPGMAIALHGNLGAGKTQFVRGVLIGLGGNPRTVSSPTYVLLNIYES